LLELAIPRPSRVPPWKALSGVPGQKCWSNESLFVDALFPPLGTADTAGPEARSTRIQLN
jgi:hypothetical protein